MTAELSPSPPPALLARLTARGIDPASLEVDSRGSIIQTSSSALASRKLVEALSLDVNAWAASTEVVDLGEPLGAGGMGIVREGHQRGLRRDVAVKEARPGPNGNVDPTVLNALLREAWIGSNLEHPNIVPVHTLVRAGADPLIVMKRVGGKSWSTMLREDERPVELGERPARALADAERLRLHFRILMRVCRAAHFAHSRGIVHLDLKPSNVMVGEYGEVYLLDWGLAAAIDHRAPPWVPRLQGLDHVVGTPAYLSPEQAEADADAIGFQTDVYLLGAIAHRIALGRAPHAAPSTMGSLVSAFDRSPPTYRRDQLPEELRGILERAMAHAPADRFASAEALRTALGEFIEHLESSALTDDALRRLVAYRLVLDAPDATSRSRRREARRLATECRFGLVEALRIWPENPTAKATLEQVAGLEVHRALDLGDWRRAMTALDWAPTLRPELEPKVIEARDDQERDRAHLEGLKAHQAQEDLSKNLRTRALTALVAGAGWAIYNLAVGQFVRMGWLEITYGFLFANMAASMVVLGTVNILLYRSLLSAKVDQRAIGIMWVMFGTTTLIWGAGYRLGTDPLELVGLSNTTYMFFIIAMTFTLDGAIGWMIPLVLPFALLMVLDVEHVYEWQAALGGVAGLYLAYLWRPQSTSGPS